MTDDIEVKEYTLCQVSKQDLLELAGLCDPTDREENPSTWGSAVRKHARDAMADNLRQSASKMRGRADIALSPLDFYLLEEEPWTQTFSLAENTFATVDNVLAKWLEANPNRVIIVKTGLTGRYMPQAHTTPLTVKREVLTGNATLQRRIKSLDEQMRKIKESEEQRISEVLRRESEEIKQAIVGAGAKASKTQCGKMIASSKRPCVLQRGHAGQHRSVNKVAPKLAAQGAGGARKSSRGRPVYRVYKSLLPPA